jgi:hypothetical protein
VSYELKTQNSKPKAHNPKPIAHKKKEKVMNKIFEYVGLALAVIFVGAGPAFAVAIADSPEPVSTTLFLVGGATLLAAKKFNKKK